MISSTTTQTNQFSYYLTGLIEGDGSIIVPMSSRDNKGRKKYPSIQIVFHSKDFPLALLILKNLTYGSLHKKKGVNAYILSINCISGLRYIVSLINGKMRTPKIYALNRLIDWLNFYNESNSSTLTPFFKYPVDSSSLANNPWLSGFIEADGSFYVRLSKPGKYPLKIECSFALEQAQYDKWGQDWLDICSTINSFLNASIKLTHRSGKGYVHRVHTANITSNSILEAYLLNFPLFGTKYLDTLDWMKVFSMFKEKTHKKHLDLIIEIKSNMNNNRHNFVWNHLLNFYSLHD